ncbi:3-phosphoshikimate 1-carboxyvinyltransferase [Shouchella clausii]|uniref:3-phosphoshikimate 1-carboxyvinyltransferase n=1 Tax=Shouchella clausii TaxID=79880 RepID=UPI00079669D7|nr:3-phosphoshikimate 1-carboxyvinyltransferase [Shouchella clausii]KKI85749.1 3-phosphoshikimate 1-carboxyvinyltransferase [Shouchella clausii]
MDETIKLLNKAESGLSGTIVVPGDKSISHRAVMFGAMANGTTNVSGFLPGDDCLSTIACFRQMGVAIEQEGDKVTVEGKGLDGLKEPNGVLDVGNSGTTIRLLLGVLSGRPFHSVVVGDDSIGKRPMARVTGPLRQMGAQIDGRETGNKTPLSIRGGQTKAIEYTMPVASAQVKSALLLAGLQAEGETSVTEPQTTRDHTERMLHAFGVKVTTAGKTISIQGGQSLQAADVVVPGDISSAAFFLVAGCIVPGSRVHLKNVGLNPTRAGILEVLKRSGAKLSIDEQVTTGGEPRGDMTISTSELSPFVIEGEEVPTLIDEIPVLAVLATQISGTTIIRDAEELKVKETNRIDTVVGELAKLGADIEATDDGMIIRGGKPLTGGKVDSHGDHRIGMALVIASLCANGPVELANIGSISVSYPQFFEHLQSLQ